MIEKIIDFSVNNRFIILIIYLRILAMESIFGHLTFTALIPDYGTLTHKDHWQS